MTHEALNSRRERPVKSSWPTVSQHQYLRDLIEVLLSHPTGLRRWSVMRAIRARCQKGGAEVPLKLEDEVERQFRRFCLDDSLASELGIGCNSEAALFYRPRERAGEVWAVNAARAGAWLNCAGEELANAR